MTDIKLIRAFRLVAKLASLPLVFLFAGSVWANDKLTELMLVSHERPGYVSHDKFKQGPLSELIGDIFALSDVKTQIELLPRRRAMRELFNSEFDAKFPVTKQEFNTSQFAYSKPFGGMRLGMLRHLQPKKGKLYTAILKEHKAYYLKSAKQIDHIVEMENYEQMLRHFKSGLVDQVFIDQVSASELIIYQHRELINRVKFEYKHFVPFYMVAKKDPRGEQAIALFNEGLKRLQQEDELKLSLIKAGYSEGNLTAEEIHIASVNNPAMYDLAKHYSETTQRTTQNVRWHFFEEDELRRLLYREFVVGVSSFDLVTTGLFEVDTWKNRGWFQALRIPLPDTIENNTEAVAKLGIRIYDETALTFIRKDLFAKHKIKVGPQPNWQEIYQLAIAIHKKTDLAGICIRSDPSWGGSLALVNSIYKSMGGEFVDGQERFSINNTIWRQTLKFYKKLVLEARHTEVGRVGFNRALEDFKLGKCAIWVDSSVAYSSLMNDDSIADKTFAFRPAPSDKSGRPTWYWQWLLVRPAYALDKANIDATLSQIERLIESRASLLAKTQNDSGAVQDLVTEAQAAYLTEDAMLGGLQFAKFEKFPILGDFIAYSVFRYVNGEISLEQSVTESERYIQRFVYAASTL